MRACPICGATGRRDAPLLRVLDATCTQCGWHYTSRVVSDQKGTKRIVSWAIDDGHSNAISAGHGTEVDALRTAQRLANERQESVFAYDESDPCKDYVEVEPDQLLIRCSAGCGGSVLVRADVQRQYPGVPVLCSECAMREGLLP